jgi:hypothetical protein
MLIPPFDSLYKFLAVFGLVLVVTGYGMYERTSRSFNEAQTSMLVEIAKVGEEELAQSTRVQELLDQLDNYDRTTADGSRQRLKILAEMKAPGLHRSIADFESSASYIKAQKTFDFERTEYSWIAELSAWMFIAGVLVAPTGFYLWYARVQLLLDKQLVAAANRERTPDPENS